MSDVNLTKLAWQTAVLPFGSKEPVDLQALDQALGFAWGDLQGRMTPAEAWLVWRLWQLGARQGSAVLLRCLPEQASGLALGLQKRGYLQADVCVDGSFDAVLFDSMAPVTAVSMDVVKERARWHYDFIVDAWRGDVVNRDDLELYARIGGGGVLFVGQDQAMSNDQRFHYMAEVTQGYTLRHRHQTVFDHSIIEAFYSLDG